MTGRFAIYAVPGARPTDTIGTELRQRAERWLGRSILPSRATPATPATPSGWTRAAVDAITASARRYGFHGTLKAPFRLAPGRTLEELDAAVARFAARRPSATVRSLTLANLGDGFFALIPGAEDPALAALADGAVTALDEFRAPLTETELARRQQAPLTPRQRELLAAWGYPYVLDEFRFHLTLTDRIPPPERPAVDRALRDWFARDLGADLTIDVVAICAEPEPGAPFTLHSVHHLQARQRQAQHPSEGVR